MKIVLMLSACLVLGGCAMSPEQAERLSALGDTLRDEPRPATVGKAPNGQCFSRGETQSGLNKICTYDCTGSAYALTVGAAELCPLTL